MTAILPANDFGSQLIKILGLPKNTIWFELRCALDEFVSLKCEYYPDNLEVKKDEIKKLLAEYELVKKRNMNMFS